MKHSSYCNESLLQQLAPWKLGNEKLMKSPNWEYIQIFICLCLCSWPNISLLTYITYIFPWQDCDRIVLCTWSLHYCCFCYKVIDRFILISSIYVVYIFPSYTFLLMHLVSLSIFSFWWYIVMYGKVFASCQGNTFISQIMFVFYVIWWHGSILFLFF